MTDVRVGIIMGSDSDLPVMQAAADVLGELGVAFEMTIVSAHRTPERLYDYARSARSRGLKVIVAGAGGAAHLPGMAAALSELPVSPAEAEAMIMEARIRAGWIEPEPETPEEPEAEEVEAEAEAEDAEPAPEPVIHR